MPRVSQADKSIKDTKLNCNYRPMKNYMPTVPASRSTAEAQDAIARHGTADFSANMNKARSAWKHCLDFCGSRIKMLPFLCICTGVNSSVSRSYSKAGGG